MDNSESTTQQEISSETTPAPETNTASDSTSQSTQTTTTENKSATTESENWEYKGDRKDVPAPFKKYVEGLDRYVSKKDQTAAELRKKAEEYDQFVASENYKAYQQFIASKPKDTVPAVPEGLILTPEESEAIAVGDPKTIAQVIQRAVERGIEQKVGPKEAELKQTLQNVTMKQQQIENAEMIQSFAEVHTDFWDLYDSGFEDYIVTSIKNGKSLEETYKAAKVIESKMIERAESSRKADLEKKKAGTVVGKSIPGTPDVVFADNEDHAKRLAIELTLKGDKRHVRIKPKK